jgi:superfamily I DNA/RNA helicase
MKRKLTDRQKELITMPPGMDVIISVAGSGKTTVLSNRIVHLIQQGFCLPEQFLVFSYTRKASEEITGRVNKLLKLKKKDKGPVASTIHTFCKNEVCEYLGIKNDTVLADSTDIEAYEIGLFNDLFNGQLDKYFGNNLHSLVKDFLNTYVISNEFISNPLLQIINFDVDKVAVDEGASGWISKEEKQSLSNCLMQFVMDLEQRGELPAELQNKSSLQEVALAFIHIIAEGITSYMTMNGIFTFDTMIASYLTITNVEKHPEYVLSLSDRFKHIVVDEFQDVKPLEMKAIHRLSTLIGSCTHAGDYAQTLYNDITQFVNNGAHATIYSTSIYNIHTMTEGFRVPDPICTVSNDLRNIIYQRIPLKITDNNMMTPSGYNGTFDIKVVIPPYVTNREVIFDSIVEHFLNIYIPSNKGKSGDSICFMAKTNNEVQTLSRIVSSKGNKVSVKYTHEKIDKRLNSLYVIVLYFLIEHGNEFSQFAGSICKKVMEVSSRIGNMVDIYFNLPENQHAGKENMKMLEYIYRNSFGIIHSMIAQDMGLLNTSSLIERNIANGFLTRESAKNLFKVFEPFNDIVEKTKSRKQNDDGKIRIASRRLLQEFKNNLFIRGIFTPSERPNAIETIHKWKNKMERASRFILSKNPKTFDDVIKYAYMYLSINNKKKQSESKLDKNISESYINQAKKTVTWLLVRIPYMFRTRKEYMENGAFLRNKLIKEALPVSKEKNVIVTDTIHSRKGLEYDHVAIVVPVVDPFPHKRNLQTLCLEYVALTRAKKNCVIYLYSTRNNYNENTILSYKYIPFFDTLKYYMTTYNKSPENCFNIEPLNVEFNRDFDLSQNGSYQEFVNNKSMNDLNL